MRPMGAGPSCQSTSRILSSTSVGRNGWELGDFSFLLMFGNESFRYRDDNEGLRWGKEYFE